MIGIEMILKTPMLDRLIADLEKNMMVAVQAAAVVVQEHVRAEIIKTSAYDTFALFESVYVSVYGRSTYEEASADAFFAYANNPTKWPDIRKIMGDDLKLNQPIESVSPFDAWVACAAAHDVPVNDGYVSFYGNWVEPRPFIALAVASARPEVSAIFAAQIRKTMGG